jgi:O-antigen/teichoic acid export membrane protein
MLMAHRRRLRAADRVTTLVAQVAIILANLIASVAIARSVGPEATGTYVEVTRCAAFALSLVSLSYAHGLAQMATHSEASTMSRCWTGALLLALPQTVVSGVLMGVVFGLLLRSTARETWVLVTWYVLALAAQFVILAGQHMLRGLQDFGGFNLNRTSQAVSWAMGCLSLAAVGHLSVTAIGLAWIMSQAVALTLVVSRLRRNGIATTRPVAVRRPLAFGLRAHVAVLGRDTAPYLDQLVIGFLLGALALGLYVPASTYSGLVLLVAIAMSFVIQPRVSAARTEDKGVVSVRLVVQTALASGCVGLLCAVTAPWMVPLVYGPAYQASGHLAALLSLAVVCDAISMAVVYALIGLGHPSRASVMQTFGTCLVVASLLVFLRGGRGIESVPAAMASAYGVTAAVAICWFLASVPTGGRKLRQILGPACLPIRIRL